MKYVCSVELPVWSAVLLENGDASHLCDRDESLAWAWLDHVQREHGILTIDWGSEVNEASIHAEFGDRIADTYTCDLWSHTSED